MTIEKDGLGIGCRGVLLNCPDILWAKHEQINHIPNPKEEGASNVLKDYNKIINVQYKKRLLLKS